MKTPRASRVRALAARLRGFLSQTQHDDQFDEEIQQHLRLLADRLVTQGMSREEAALAAPRQFGNPITLQEDRRALQTLPSIESLWQDLRYALRMLRRNPGFSILAVLVLALGIGANSAVFTVADAVLFKPLAFVDPDRLVSFGSVWPTKGTRASVVSLPDVMDWRAGSSAFLTLAYYRRSQQAVIVGDAADFADVVRTSPEFFRLFGVTPLMGRLFAPDEDRMVIREGVVLAAAGMIAGVPGAIAVTGLLGTLLFEVQPYDPLTYAGGVVFLSVVTFIACYIPASKAAGIDPLEALRVE